MKRIIVLLAVAASFITGACLARVFSLARARPAPPPAPLFTWVFAAAPADVIAPSRGFSGNPAAPFTLIEFGDYECPPCANAHHAVRKLLDRYPAKLRVQFRHLPLHKFEAVHRALFLRNARLNEKSLRNVAASNRIVLSPGVAARCRKNIEQDRRLAGQHGIDETPTFLLCFPNGKVVRLVSLDAVHSLLR